MKRIWKAYVLPSIDYCSVLWFNLDKPGEIHNLERAQNRFLSRIEGFRTMNYWERLRAAKMMSIQRRLERYIILYTWKSLEGLVPDLAMNWNVNSHKDRVLSVPPLKRTATRIMTLREGTIQVSGPKLFNCLPDYVRALTGCSLDVFKKNVDTVLDLLPDEPSIPGLCSTTVRINSGRNSNCLINVFSSHKSILDTLTSNIANL